MSERVPLESSPDVLETQRDALLARVVEMRERVQHTDLDKDLVAKELSELSTRIQQVQGAPDLQICSEVLDVYDASIDRRTK